MGTPEIASLSRLVEEVIAQKAPDLEQESIVLRAQLGRDLPATWISQPAIRQVLVSCIDNAALAIRAAGRSGTIELATELDDDHILVRIRDDGPGLPRAALSQLAGGRLQVDRREPDLGLSLGREIVAQHGGTLTGRNRSQGGAELTLRLPLALAPDDRPAAAAGARELDEA
jgi:signal transduction histidine kinase